MLNERGLALPLTLIIMIALTPLTIALLALAGSEPQISSNLTAATQARFAAEAGVEWAFNNIASTADWSTMLVGADPTTGVEMINGSPIGTLAAAHGTYTVRLRNDTLAGDPAITGVAADANATLDANRAVIVTSTGNLGTATKTLRAAIRRLTFPGGLFPAAFALPGNEAEMNFSGNSFEVDGRGWNTDGTLDAGCAEVYGIAVSSVLPAGQPGANEAVVESALSGQQLDNVKGKKQNPAGLGEGFNTVSTDPVLTPELIQNFINNAKSLADITLQSQQPSGLSFNSIGSTCATDVNSPTCWGTASNPKVVYIKGDPDPSSAFSALQLSGDTEGHGILIVEDGDFKISGNFAWYGPIIVTGKWVGVGFLGGGFQQVYGSIISNETATDAGFREGVVTGNAKVRYSCQALNRSLNTRRLTTISTWKDLEPGE